jgi:hypothetical protein
MSKGLEVLVTFPPSIPTAAQGQALMHLEMELRAATKMDVRVVKDLKGDDSKLRVMMTTEQRDKL